MVITFLHLCFVKNLNLRCYFQNSTMSYKLIVLVMFCVTLTSSQKLYDCISVLTNPKTRYFNSLVEYQGNKRSFKPGGRGYAGNLVEFNFMTIDKVPKNSFLTYDSGYVMKISLAGKNVKEIEDGAFLFLQCLHVLDLHNNSLVELTQDIFQGLENLVELDLSQNLLVEVRNVVFKHLARLTVLNLSQNKIVQIGVMAFDGLNHLQHLDLSRNRIRIIHPEIFSSLGRLLTLELQSNRLVDVQPETWKNLTKLDSLNLANNSLARFDPTYEVSFAFLSNLNLSFNSLKHLNVFGLRKHLPHLTNIDLNDNPWFCADLAMMVHQLKDSKISYAGSNTSFANEEGIACIPTAETYRPVEKAKATVEEVANSTESELEGGSYGEVDTLAGFEILDAIRKTQNLVVSLIVIILFFIAIDLTIRTGLMNKMRGRREHFAFDNGHVENIGLLRA